MMPIEEVFGRSPEADELQKTNMEGYLLFMDQKTY